MDRGRVDETRNPGLGLGLGLGFVLIPFVTHPFLQERWVCHGKETVMEETNKKECKRCHTQRVLITGAEDLPKFSKMQL